MSRWLYNHSPFKTDLPFPLNLLWIFIVGFVLAWYAMIGAFALALIVAGLVIGHFVGWSAFGIYWGILALISTGFWVKENEIRIVDLPVLATKAIVSFLFGWIPVVQERSGNDVSIWIVITITLVFLFFEWPLAVVMWTTAALTTRIIYKSK